MNDKEEQVILVDEEDNQIGVMDKLETHKQGLLHRCFSIVLFDAQGKILVTQRAPEKYHCGGMWTNTCCSHPREGESTADAAHRRLKEELGIQTQLEETFSFTYRAEFDNGLTEHEFDHVFFGKYSGEINPDPSEVSDYKWMTLQELEEAFHSTPHEYTVWFRILIEKAKEKGLL